MKFRKKHDHHAAVLPYWALTAALLAGPLSARAQEAAAVADTSAPPTAAAVQDDDIEEVTVTARRREESLEKVPTSIIALSASALEAQGIVSQSDLQTSVPGLTVRQTQGSNSLTFSIRGQTVDAFTGSRTAVIPYFNEVQLNSGGASTFFDLESIQVLKGPQGTLFGRNTTGGAVLYTSAKPDEESGGYVKYRGGSYDLSEGQAAVNVPLLDKTLLIRLAGDLIYQDGFQHNLYDGRDLGEIDRQSGRLSALWRPIEKFENSLVFEADRVKGNSTATRLRTVNRIDPNTFQCVNPNVANCSSDLLYSPLVDTVFQYPGLWAAYTAVHPNLNPNGIGAYLDQDSPHIGFWDANEVAPVFHYETDYLVSNASSFELTDKIKLKNIFGYSNSDTRDLGSSVGAPYGVFYSANLARNDYGNHVQNRSYSDELQLQGLAMDDALTYIVGAYYQKEVSKTLFPQVYFDYSPVLQGTSVDSHFQIEDETPAVFAQGSYALTPKLSFTLGARYTWESVSIKQLALSSNLLDPSQPTHQSTSDSNPSWTVGLSYQTTEDLMFYLTSRGSWRSGGFNGTAPPTVAGVAGLTNRFDAETTYDVEIGAKFAGRILDRPVRANVAVFNQWIDDVQRAEFPDPPGPASSIAYTVNVPQARVSGLEMDLTIKPLPRLETGLSGAWTYARFIDGKNTAEVFGTTYRFGPYADSPRASGSLYASLLLPTPDHWGAMDVRADLYGQTSLYFSNNNSTITPDTQLPGYGIVNLRYSWQQMLGSKFSLAAYVKNLTDKEYYAGGFALTASLGVNSTAVGTPRMFGAELNYAF
ncbi:MAG: hypothetical protein JWQ90_4639 [Hydrocarboniphaga sp.]|uniref:TonB-dependent receptor n=1 Tax=Hydrocarboniphaga sp. TaxID=2033016 RepID=UPI00262A5EAF|nr:TonB-dependent receptor [Hydrocarboniphaga sp.]MDB5972189.1 hypothetical protein [Hydrocarboniphaga sp.]